MRGRAVFGDEKIEEVIVCGRPSCLCVLGAKGERGSRQNGGQHIGARERLAGSDGSSPRKLCTLIEVSPHLTSQAVRSRPPKRNVCT